MLPDQDPFAAIDLTLAAVIAHRVAGEPVWLMLVAPPSSMKTELLHTLKSLTDAHFTSTLTENTLLSGYAPKGKRDTQAAKLEMIERQRKASLLFRMEDSGRNLLVFKDFTTILEMRRDTRNAILGQLREVYDGSITKDIGTEIGALTWEGRMSFLAGVTPGAIDQHAQSLAIMGDRFLYLRFKSPDRDAMAAQAIRNRSRESLAEMRTELSDAVATFLDGLDYTADVDVKPDILERIGALADFATRGRTSVTRDGYGSRDILFVPEIEGPARFAHQLVNITTGLLMIGIDHDTALAYAERVAMDSMPPPRVALLRCFAYTPEVRLADLGKVMSLPRTTARRIAEDLEALGFLTTEQADGWNQVYEDAKDTKAWRLSDEGRKHFESIGWSVADPVTSAAM